MPQSTAVQTWNRNRLVPLYNSEDARIAPINLPPNKTYVAGTVMGQIASSANDIQTVTVTGTPTGGTFTLTGTNPFTGATFTTAAIAYNAAASAVASAVSTALGISGATVTGGGGALPGTAVTLTFTGVLAARPVPILALGTNSLTGGTTPTAAVAHTTIGRSAKTFDAYADTTATDPARVVLEYDVTTDAAGNVQYNDAAGVSGGQAFATAYYCGAFHTGDLTGLDAGAVVDMGGHLVAGTVTSGTLVF
jgi:hypothetical protein